MKRIFSILSFFAIVHFTFAQTSNLVVFSDGSENFTLFVNGVRQNGTPASNVRATGLVGDMCKVRVVFEKGAIPEITRNLMLDIGLEQNYSIVKNKKGEFVLRLNGSGPIQNTADVASLPAAPRASVAPSSPPAPSTTTSSSVTTVTTTTQQQKAVPGENVSMTMNTPEGNVSLSVSVSGGDNATGAVAVSGVNMTGSVTTTSTTTTTSSSTQVGNTQVRQEAASAAPAKNCAFTDSDFASAVSSIKSKSFADVKMSTSKQAIRNRCLTTKQAKQIIELFDFEEDKLAFAKHAYASVSDKENYFQVSDLFDHASTQDEFNEFLAGQN